MPSAKQAYPPLIWVAIGALAGIGIAYTTAIYSIGDWKGTVTEQISDMQRRQGLVESKLDHDSAVLGNISAHLASIDAQLGVLRPQHAQNASPNFP